MSVTAQIVAFASTFLSGTALMWAGKLLEPKTKLVYWSPRIAEFILPIPNLQNALIPGLRLPASDFYLPQKDVSDHSEIRSPAIGVELANSPPPSAATCRILVGTLFIQNAGTKAAEQIEICYKEKPTFVKLYPSFDYEETKTPDGAYLLKIKSLAPKDTVCMEILATNNPALYYVRCANAPAPQQLMNWVYQGVQPKWVTFLFLIFALIGLSVVFACIVLAILNALNVYTLPHNAFTK